MRQLRPALILFASVLAAAGPKPTPAAELELSIPSGYCALSDGNFTRLMTTSGDDFATANLNLRQLAVFADCAKCPEWPAQRNCSAGYGLYLENPHARQMASLPRPEFLDRIEQTFGIAQPPRISETAAALLPGQDVVNLGVLHRDEAATYIGHLHRDRSSHRAWVSVMGYTTVQGRFVLLKLGAPYEDEATIQGLLKLQSTSLSRVVEAN
jgi:hypothetical protein